MAYKAKLTKGSCLEKKRWKDRRTHKVDWKNFTKKSWSEILLKKRGQEISAHSLLAIARRRADKCSGLFGIKKQQKKNLGLEWTKNIELAFRRISEIARSDMESNSANLPWPWR